MAVVESQWIGGVLARQALPWIVLLPTSVGWLLLQGERAGYYNTEIGLTLFATGIVLIFSLLFWFSARTLNQLYAEQAERNFASTRDTAIVKNSVDAIIGKSLEGIVTSWNPGAEKIFGYSEAEMIGQSINRLVPAEHQCEEKEILARLGRGETIDHFETTRSHKDGRLIQVSVTVSPIVDMSGRVIGASKVARDITERKKAEAALAAALQRMNEFKTALDQHAIVAITDPQGKITYVNDQFCQVSKYRREELIGQDHRIVNSGFHPKDFFHGMWATIGRGEIWRGEIKNRAKDGSYYWVDTALVPFLDEHGKPRQYMAIRVVITATKLAQEDLARSNRDLEQFAYVASHDLQEPLRAVAGCLQILQRRYEGKLDAGATELIGHSVDGAYRMQSLIEGLLAFSRVGTAGGAIENIDTESSLEVALKNLATAIKESGATITHTPLPRLRADASQLTLVFQNLIGNALKFRGPAAPLIQIRAEHLGDGWILSVQDNGIGIEAKFFDRIFVIFQRLHTRTEFPGTGLGLAI